MYDFHTHLNCPTLFSSREKLISHFVTAGGTGILLAGADEIYNTNAISLRQQTNLSCSLEATIGLHPYEVVKDEEGRIENEEDISLHLATLTTMYKENKNLLLGIGECGIDLHYSDANKKIGLQKRLFTEQCHLASQYACGLVVHSRDAFTETMDVLTPFIEKLPWIYFHCRGYGPSEVKTLFRSGNNFFIGYTGNITYKNAEDTRQSLLVTPRDRFVLETDAPYLSPQVIRGQTNEPANVAYIYDYVASLLQIHRTEVDQLMQDRWKKITEKNN